MHTTCVECQSWCPVIREKYEGSRIFVTYACKNSSCPIYDHEIVATWISHPVTMPLPEARKFWQYLEARAKRHPVKSSSQDDCGVRMEFGRAVIYDEARYNRAMEAWRAKYGYNAPTSHS